MIMKKRLIFNCFSMNVVSHIWHGTWRHPDVTQSNFDQLETWTELAEICERGRFDNLFLADVIGIDPAYKGSWDSYIKEGLHIPCHDPAALCSALIGKTEHLGLTFTSSVMSEHPFSFARKVSTMDHLSKGRIGWNIVTSVSHNAAQNYGFDKMFSHDERYARAEEFMDVVYKLWEGSWDDGAVLKDKVNGVYADASKIHRIFHQGDRYKVLGPHLCSPSTQRTPVLFQAGSSPVGRAFAARHAEGTFVLYPNIEGARKGISETRAVMKAAGRNPDDLKFIQGLSFVVGSTEEEAQRKSDEIDGWVSYEGLAAHISRDISVDLGMLDPETLISEADIEGIRGFATMFEAANPGKKARVADIAHALSYASRVVGTPESIADQLEAWQEAGIDGVNMIAQFFPGSYREFVDQVMPVLQERGLAQREYAPGTLREKMFPGSDGRLPSTHVASRYRGSFSGEAAKSAKGTGVEWPKA
jgi:FMN-dependent oxidoreductase (nitrilotriacetate monooxygenase family)